LRLHDIQANWRFMRQPNSGKPTDMLQSRSRTERGVAIPGWYDDGHHPGHLRWWGGTEWTDYFVPIPSPEPAPAPEVDPPTPSKPAFIDMSTLPKPAITQDLTLPKPVVTQDLAIVPTPAPAVIADPAVVAGTNRASNDVVGWHADAALTAAALPDLDREYEQLDFAMGAAKAIDKAQKTKTERAKLEGWVAHCRAEGHLHPDWRYSRPGASSNGPVLQDIERRLDLATAYAAVGDVGAEQGTLSAAVDAAKRFGGSKVAKATVQKIVELRGDGRLYVGAQPLGSVAPENAFGQFIRTGGEQAIGGRQIDVYSDRVVQGSLAYRIDAQSVAQVYLDGQMQITQRPTLTRMGLLSWLPGNALIAGMATQKKVKNDSRSAVFMIGSASWSITVPIHPGQINGPREVALKVNAIVDQLTTAQAMAPMALAAREDVVLQLERLHALVQAGVLSAEEGQRLKEKLLRF